MSGMQTDLSLRGQTASLGKERFSGSESLISDARRRIAQGSSLTGKVDERLTEVSSEYPGMDMRLVEHPKELMSRERSELRLCVEPESILSPGIDRSTKTIRPETLISRENLSSVLEFLRHEVVFFHGTSGALFESIKEHGLVRDKDPVGRAWAVYNNIHELVTGRSLPNTDHRTERIVFTTGNAHLAWQYAKAGGEAFEMMLRDIPIFMDKFKISPEQRDALGGILRDLKELQERHSPVILKISGSILDYSKEPAIEILERVFREGEYNGAIRKGLIRAQDFVHLIQWLHKSEFQVSEVPKDAILDVVECGEWVEPTGILEDIPAYQESRRERQEEFRQLEKMKEELDKYLGIEIESEIRNELSNSLVKLIREIEPSKFGIYIGEKFPDEFPAELKDLLKKVYGSDNSTFSDYPHEFIAGILFGLSKHDIHLGKREDELLDRLLDDMN